ncbi:uncharacterized protein ACLA_071600 [Aspergillus clavatus NRRL 1]|uniref:Uncharacterized protein n=1 Tax=Aspergillus clavatus (strain ATCC 1007 / CBS 513.65 / DSM 816 / NCTC 3887 / NRRL 1 / QM 1276 / 107) TaxID=344612 RepID=A1C6V6_ASPCL|nr:uncharacterized protein ACLA_071600 [Aspergillus clavatus NRRL 1]EAW14127.1 conserved hypothetical protein [Aspergillus clavatus NRRL 1]
MGYTHYYTIHNTDSVEWQTAWSQLVADAQRIVNVSGISLAGPGREEHSRPIINEEDGIMLNGVGQDGHEPLCIDKHGVANFGFIKTARKPYDAVAACILLRAWVLAPNCIEVEYGERYIETVRE